MAMSDRVAVFQQGRIEQVAPPEVLYEEPERQFVARFIGDNNILYGRVVGVDGDYCQVDVGSGIVRAFRIAPSRLGDTVAIAIRPERVSLAPKPGVYHNEFDAQVNDIMFLGDHLRLRLTVCGHSDFIAKIPNIVGHGAVLEGDQVRIGWLLTDCRSLEAPGQE
jgi:putative spermidine/putrescine transport system ATP-binding protein